MFLVKKVINIIMFVLMIGCSNLPSKYNQKIFQEQYKAVVIIDIVTPNLNFFNKYYEQKINFLLVKLNDSYNDPNKRETYFINTDSIFSGNYNNKLFMINPGIYYIDSMSWKENYYGYSTMYNTILPGISKTGLVVYGAFEVKPGDIAYVGKLLLNINNIKGKNFGFDIEKINDIDQIKKDLVKNKQNELINKIKEVKFYGKGSVVNRSPKGVFTIKD